MHIAHRAGMALLLGAAWAAAQVASVPAAALHLTVNYPSSSIVSTMFGMLPKNVALIEVTACNDTPSALLLSNGRLVQALRRNGIQALSRDAAIATMQSAEGRTWQSLLLRNASHGMNIVNFLVISKAVALGPGLSKTLPSVQALLEAIVPELSKDVPDHRYLNFDHDALPDKAQLSALDCATGLMFTMKSGKSGAAVSEITIDVPALAAK